jgi:hypothetical protein
MMLTLFTDEWPKTPQLGHSLSGKFRHKMDAHLTSVSALKADQSNLSATLHESGIHLSRANHSCRTWKYPAIGVHYWIAPW